MMIKNGYAESGDIYTWEFQNTKNRKWYLLRDAIIKWIDGRDVHIETATEITQWKEYEEQLKQSASIDSLTGVYNREWGHQLMKEVVEHPGARKKEISLVFTDLDDLKHINDAYGHDVGDRMLRDLAELFRTNIRRSDIICRWGGDEFVILLKCGIVVAEKIMRSMEEKLGKINQMRGEPLGLAFSYGIAEPGEDADITVDTLVSRADRQMYKNKMAKGKRTK
jgi:diguanylate cyclase (GGDEF) domain